MALSRIWLTPLVDDSGSGTDGSIVDKQLFLDFADDIDANVGTVRGPTSSVDDRIATFDGTTGKLLQDGGQTIAEVIAAAGGATTGTWTPIIGGTGGTTGQTYSLQVGHYFKFGALVIAFGDAQLSAKGTITGSVRILGLPFTVLNSSAFMGAAITGYFETLATAVLNLYGNATPNTTQVTLRMVTAATTTLSTFPTTTDISNTTRLSVVVVYEAAP